MKHYSHRFFIRFVNLISKYLSTFDGHGSHTQPRTIAAIVYVCNGYRSFKRGDKYVCGICGKEFPSKWSLALHIRTYHKMMLQALANDALLVYDFVKEHSKQRGNSYICLICGKEFPSAIEVTNHILSEHSLMVKKECLVY